MNRIGLIITLRNFFILMLLVMPIAFSSCATVFGGPRTSYQVTIPKPGEPQREVRIVPLLIDVIFWPSLVVDFATGAIYKPSPSKRIVPPETNK